MARKGEGQGGRSAEADALIVANVGWAANLARRVVRGLDCVDHDDVVSEALIALVTSAGRFNPARGIDFKKYAANRIRGAIKDWQRRNDVLTRHERDRVNKTGTLPDIVPTFAKRDVSDLRDGVLARKAFSAMQYHTAELDEALRDIRSLPERHRFVMERLFLHGETLDEIGAAMGISESWACKISGEAKVMLAQIRELPRRRSRKVEP